MRPAGKWDKRLAVVGPSSAKNWDKSMPENTQPRQGGQYGHRASTEDGGRCNQRSNDVLSRTVRLSVSTIRRKRGTHQSLDRRVPRAHLFSQSPSTPPRGKRACSCARAKARGGSGGYYSNPGRRWGERNSAVCSTVVAELRRTVNLTPVLNQEFKLSLYNLLGLWIRPP